MLAMVGLSLTLLATLTGWGATWGGTRAKVKQLSSCQKDQETRIRSNEKCLTVVGEGMPRIEATLKRIEDRQETDRETLRKLTVNR